MKLDELVANYIKLRDKKSQLKKQYDEKVAKVDAVMDKMEAIILKTFQDSGIDSARTDAGTAYISTRTSATVANREEFFSWVLQDTEERITRICKEWAAICESGRRHGAKVGAQECVRLIKTWRVANEA